MNLGKIIPITIFFTLTIFLSALLLILWNFNKKNQISTVAGDMMYNVIFTNADENETINLLTKLLQENSNYRYLAQFKLANIYSNKKDLTEMLDMYSSLVGDNQLSSVLNRLAQYFKAVILTKINTRNQQAVYNSLANEVYSSSAQEINAIHKLKNNEAKHAIDILNSIINDENSPPPVKKNAKELLQIALASY